MKKLFTTILVICGAYIATAQAPEIEWQKNFGGSNNDIARSVQQTTDDGYIVAGLTYSNNGDVTGYHGNVDAWVIKIDATGILQWEKALGGSSNDEAYSIQQTTDGGYIIAGLTKSNNGDVSGNHGGADYWVVKLSSDGSIEWQKSLGGSDDDVAYSVQQTADGGYIVAGSSRSNDGDVSGNHGQYDIWIVKLNTVGDLEWQKALGGSGDEGESSHSSVFGFNPVSIQQTTDNGYIVTGLASSTDGDVTGWHEAYNSKGTPRPDYWIVKLNQSGNIEWEKTLGGTLSDYSNSIQQTSDGGYIVAGNAISYDGDVSGSGGYGGNADYWIVKLSSTGNIQWKKALGGTASDEARSIHQTAGGNYIVTGLTYSNDGDVTNFHGGNDWWVVKLNSAGVMQWQKALGGSASDNSWCVRQTSNGGYIVVGSSSSTDGDITNNIGGADFWIVKLTPDDDSMATLDQQFSQLEIFPNPAKDVVHFSKSIDGELFDASGKKILTIKKAESVNVSSLSKGVYILKTSEGITKKIVVK